MIWRAAVDWAPTAVDGTRRRQYGFLMVVCQALGRSALRDYKLQTICFSVIPDAAAWFAPIAPRKLNGTKPFWLWRPNGAILVEVS